MESTEGEAQGQTTPQEEPASQTNATISESGRTRTHHTGVTGPSKIYPSEHVWEYRWELEAIPPAMGKPCHFVRIGRKERSFPSSNFSVIDRRRCSEGLQRIPVWNTRAGQVGQRNHRTVWAILHRRDKRNLRTFRVQKPTAERRRDVRVLPRIDQAADQIV